MNVHLGSSVSRLISASVTGGKRPASNIHRIAKNLAAVGRSKRTHDIDIAALDKIPKPGRRQDHGDGQASDEQQMARPPR